ncbi:O-antigen ligase family protein [Cohnella rhizosphaerae]|uniref:O-antigen ligase family protein n=1 Tax=Cohnella rhizosphaerae TaxID=1457232 RepID=A0A9X4KVS1_9BACL|nr:O-antigen ligase family protein [Cohnella rhizosphaerae]MDG0811802.1 O-antigen ligase family protein [Cohnella rhizosphaerae]
MFFYSLFALLVAFIVYTPIADRGYDVALQISNAIYNKQPIQTVSFFFSKSIQTWGLLIGATLAFGLLSYTYGRFLSSKLHLSKLESNNRYRIIIPGIIVLLTIFGVLLITSSSILNLFPTFISDRLGDVSYKTQSVYERLTMYKDAFSLWKTAPMLGGGGGAWDASYQTYQSYPYLSNKTHSYPMQLLVETGALGFLLYLLLIAGVFYVFYKFYRKASHTQRLNYVPFYLIALTILVHSLIDFEMSYGLNVILVYLCLGVLGGTLNKPLYNKVKEIKQSLSIKKSNFKRNDDCISFSYCNDGDAAGWLQQLYVFGRGHCA